jgi:hypothetical protein
MRGSISVYLRPIRSRSEVSIIMWNVDQTTADFFLNLILFAICTNTFSKLCKRRTCIANSADVY